MANPSKGKRFNSGKPQISLVLEAKEALSGAAIVFEKNLPKYGRANWRLGLSHTQIMDSLSRHLMAYASGEDMDVDPITGAEVPHVDAITCNALMLAEMYRLRKDLDDRPIVEGHYKVKPSQRGKKK